MTSTKANGAYPVGTLIAVTVTFGENVTVTGTPTIALNSGGSASYSSGTGSATLTFNYTTGAGDNAADLDYSATNSLVLAGGTIKDAATNNATLTLPAVGGASSIGGQKAIVVDTNNPTATVTTPGVNGNTYNAASLPGNLAGSSADTGGSSTVSTVQVAIQDGSGNYWGGATFNQVAIFYSATGGTTAAWTYATATLAGQLTDGHTYTITARSTDPAGNTGTADRTFVFDSAAPTVTNVTSTKANGIYPVGTLIPVTVTFSENVDVTGNPSIALNSGGSASYSSGTGSATLTFNYTVGATDNSADLDYSATTSLALAGGTIKDAAANNATLTLPTVGGASSIGGQKAIVVDTDNPTASVTTPAVNGNSYNATSLPASLAGSSADTGGSSTVSTVQVAIQDDAGNYWGGATFNQASIFYNATGGTTAAWTYATPGRRATDQRPHLHHHRPLHRRRRQYGHDHPHLRLRHNRADGHQRELLDRGRRLPRRPGRHDHGDVQRERDRHRLPDDRAQLRRLGELQRRLGRHDAQLHLQHRRRRERIRPRLQRHDLARARRRHRQGRSHQQRDPDPAHGRRRLEHRGPEGDPDRHRQPDRLGDNAGRRRPHLQRGQPPRQPCRQRRRHRRLQHRLHDGGRNPG